MKLTRRFPFITRQAASIYDTAISLSELERAVEVEAEPRNIVDDDGELRPQFASKADDSVEVLFFDGYKFSSVSKNKSPGLYTGYGSSLHLPSGKLRDDDVGRAMAYLACEYAYNGIRMVASDIAGIKFGVRNIETKQDNPNHPLILAINWARRIYQQEVISLWQINRYVFGEVYALPEANMFGYYNCLRLLNPLAVEKWLPYNTLDGFQYSANGDYRLFEPSEIAFDKVANPLDDINGLAPLSVALDAINIDKEMKRYTLDNFLKNMRMSGILTGRTGSSVTQQDLDSVVKRLKEQKGERLVAITPQLEYKQVQQSVDGSQLQLSEDARRRIAAALGIPLSVLGAWDSSTFQSAPEQRRHYYESVIFRECIRHALYMTEQVLPYFDSSGSNEVYYDIDAVSALVEDKATKTTMINSRQAAGNMTINEARVALGDKPIEGGDVLILNGQLMPLTQLATMVAQPVAPLTPVVTPTAALPAPAPEKAVEPTAQVGMKDAWLGLTLPNHPDLIPLQARAKQLIGEGQCEWNDPADFHVTLLYIPAISEDEATALLEAMNEVDVPEMALRVGSLGVFDNVGEHAVHFKIRQNADLKDLQETLYDICVGLGLRMRSFYQPSQYQPHVTMGYAAQPLKRVVYTGKTAVQPSEMHLGIGDEVVYRKACGKPPIKSEPLPEPQTIHEAALDELNAWQKKVKNNGAFKAAEFKNYLIPDEVAQGVREILREPENADVIRETFRWARERISIRAIQATRIDFEDAFADLLDDALKGNITRRQWTGRLRSMIETYGYKAYTDGLRDGGVDAEPDSDESAQIVQLVRDQSPYISGLADTIFKDENTVISAAIADQKPAMWYNKSINPFYQSGLASADGNSMYEWVYGDTEHCADCNRLNGQVHRMKDYTRKNVLPQSDNLACKGFNCKCKLVKTANKANGSW